MSKRYICIHGHFYQPPRENAWLEAIERQESAFPDHDWNERITDECYGPNARARLIDSEGWIRDITSNYARISFNFGPTLLAWLQAHAPAVYQGILDADKESAERFGGHGSAMAQVYNHAIMPLCNERDLRTQVRWGVKDFEHRFGRRPEGMWLAETAANTASLEALAEEGIVFTVLAPRQGARVRRIGQEAWDDVAGRIDPSMAYLCRLPSGRTINLFFYDGPISQGVAFEGLLHSGERFAHRLLDAFDDARPWAQLAHIATDGETYGHHHRNGDLALAAALAAIEARPDVRLTNYAQFLELHPPTHEAQIIEDSSWSCVHGVERWRSDCGCHSGAHNDWHQGWRAPLRSALDTLRDGAAPLFEKEAASLLRDPWGARDAYIDVVLDRSPDSLAKFFATQGAKDLSPEERTRALKLLELQRHAMLMYTSCGWFFDDISGIETVQVIQYAGRVIQLAKGVLSADFEGAFLDELQHARGNIPARGDGRQVYVLCVRPAMVDLLRVGAHYAVSSLFEGYAPTARVYCYDVVREHATLSSAGRARLMIGRARITSGITLESGTLTFGVLHLGDHTLNCGVRPFQGEEAYTRMQRETTEAFDRADFAAVLRHMDHSFGSANYSIDSLFRDEQRAIVRQILEPTLSQVDAAFRQIYEQNAPFARFLRRLDLHVPRRFQLPAGFVLNEGLRGAMAAEHPDLTRIDALLAEAVAQGVELDGRPLAFALEETMEAMIGRINKSSSVEDLEELERTVQLAHRLPFEVDLWQVQDGFHRMTRSLRPGLLGATERGDLEAGRWLAAFDAVGTALKVRVL